MKAKIGFIALVAGLIFFLASLVGAFDKTAVPLRIEPPEGQVLILSSSVVDIHVIGIGWGYVPDPGTRKLVKAQGSFVAQGSGFMVNDRYIVTANHVIEPDRLIIRQQNNIIFNTKVYGVVSKTILIGDGFAEGGVPAVIVYSDKENDIALLMVTSERTSTSLKPLPFATQRTVEAIPWGLSWMTVDWIHPGDPVVALVHKRDENGDRSWTYEIRKGTIIAAKPVVPEEVQDALPWFGMNDITICMKVYPGDSGSPLIAFHEGKPVIIGVIRAMCLIGEETSYAVRIDILMRILEGEEK